MELAPTTSSSNWVSTLRDHARNHPLVASGLSVSLIVVIGLLLQSLMQAASAESKTLYGYALLGGTAGFLATTLGALPAFVLRSIPQQMEDSMLGFAAGMMLAASAFSLLLPGLAAGEEILGSMQLGAGVVVLGMVFGVLLMLGLDVFTPHEHEQAGTFGPGHEFCARLWLVVFAIALHNLPEGMAIGVSFSQGDMSVGLPLTTAIAIQDIPEGLAVALAVRHAGYPVVTAVLVSALSGLLEPIGAILGMGLSTGLPIAYPIGLGLAAGAMIFVVSHEIIPETHRNGHQTMATVGLVAGFALMMVLDTTLG